MGRVFSSDDFFFFFLTIACCQHKDEVGKKIRAHLVFTRKKETFILGQTQSRENE